jgi:hypothetical protein
MLKSDLRTTIETLIKGGGSLRQIARSTGVDHKTIRHLRHQVSDGSPLVATEGVAAALSAGHCKLSTGADGPKQAEGLGL